jgi:hypothetical protein
MYLSIKPYPKMKEAKTIIIDSIEEKPMSLNALVKIKYPIYRAKMGKKMYKRYRHSRVISDTTDMTKTFDIDIIYKPCLYLGWR